MMFFGIGIDLDRSLYYHNLFDGTICVLLGYFWGIREYFLFGYGSFISLSGLVWMYYGCTLGVLSEGGVLGILSKQGVLGVPFETKLCY